MKQNSETANKFFDVVFLVSCPNDAWINRPEPDRHYTEIKANKEILAAQSDVFAAMFFGSGDAMNVQNDGDGDYLVVYVDDVESHVFEFLIDFIYDPVSANFTITEENFKNVAYAAEKYNIETLRQKCSDAISDKLNVLNCVRFWATAKACNLPELEVKAFLTAESCPDLAFSPDALKYATAEMWISILSSKNFKPLNIENILTNAIFWAASCEDSVTDVRRVLRNFQPLFEQHYTKFSPTRALNDLYFIFLPDFRLPNPTVTSVEVKRNCASKDFRPQEEWHAVQFTLNNQSAFLVDRDNGLKAREYREGNGQWITLDDKADASQRRMFCEKHVKYTVVFPVGMGTSKTPTHDLIFVCAHSDRLRRTLMHNYYVDPTACDEFCFCDKGCLPPISMVKSSDGVLDVTVYASSATGTLVFEA